VNGPRRALGVVGLLNNLWNHLLLYMPPAWWVEEKAKAEMRAKECKQVAKKVEAPPAPDDHKKRTPRCRVCAHPTMFCICTALQLWQDEHDLPKPVIPFVRKVPDGDRADGFPHPDIVRGVGRDADGNMMPHKDEHGNELPWLPTLMDDTHYGS